MTCLVSCGERLPAEGAFSSLCSPPAPGPSPATLADSAGWRPRLLLQHAGTEESPTSSSSEAFQGWAPTLTPSARVCIVPPSSCSEANPSSPEAASCGLGPPAPRVSSSFASPFAPAQSGQCRASPPRTLSSGLGPPVRGVQPSVASRVGPPSSCSESKPSSPRVASCGLGPPARRVSSLSKGPHLRTSAEQLAQVQSEPFRKALSPKEAAPRGQMSPSADAGRAPIAPGFIGCSEVDPNQRAAPFEAGRPLLAPSFIGCKEYPSPRPSPEFRQPSSSPARKCQPCELGGAAASLPACEPQGPLKAPELGPGARAPSVRPSELWSEFFLSVSRAKCSLSSFFHSIRLLPRAERGPSRTSRARRGGRIWPMPLPFPAQLRSGGTRDPEQLGLNAVVLVLNWTFLGQPAVAPRNLELALGEPLTEKQLAAVDSLRVGVQAWNRAGPFSARDLGRSASKFEGLQDMLEACQAEWAKVPKVGGPGSGRLFSYSTPCPVLPVEPSRLNFVGKPSFDPLPYLDSRNRASYARPLDFAREIAPEEPVPRVAVRADQKQTSDLLRLLDETGRLALFRREEVRPRLRNGLFSVAKDSARDRMVLDARPPNLAEETENRWIRSLGTLEQFQFIYLPPECDFEIHTEDLKEFYHAFIVSEQRARRNVFALELEYEDVLQLSACSRSLRGHTVIPALKTMAMGDLNAVAYGQTAHLAVLLRTKAVSLSQFISLQGRPPRPGQQVAGLLIDDFVLLDPVPRCLTAAGIEPPGVRTMQTVIQGYKESGLPRNESKAVSRASEAEFWGGSLNGRTGILRPSPKRVCSLAQFILRVVQGGITSVGMLEVIAGGLVSGLQLRRRLLSLLDAVYQAQRHQDRRAFVPVRGDLCNELLSCVALLCQVDVDLRAPAAPVLLSTDASSSAEAGAAAFLPSTLSLELTRHCLQRGLWTRLLSPAQAYLRERGELDEGLGMPDEVYTSHPLWEELCCGLRFSQFGRTVRVNGRRHINIGEVRAAIRGEELLGSLHPGHRYVHLQDSQVALATFIKGRSSSPSLNRELRRSLASYIANRVRPSYGYIQSKMNPSDDPTRGAPLRSPSRPLESWLQAAWNGNFDELDAFLCSLDLEPRQLAGLPPEEELWPDAPLAEVPGRATKRLRAKHGPETKASSLMLRSQVGVAEAFEIFRRLPKEVSARSSRWSRAEASFSAGVFVHGGITGLRRSCELFPSSVQLLARVLREAKPGFIFSSLSVNQNVRTLPHIDRNNLSGEPNLVVPLSRFRGGGIWVQTDSGSVPQEYKGKTLFGEVLPVHERAVAFDPHRVHCTQSWVGSRVVLIGFTVRGCEKLTEAQRATALGLGFVLPPLDQGACPRGTSPDDSLEPLEGVQAPAILSTRSPGLGACRVDPSTFPLVGEEVPAAFSGGTHPQPVQGRGLLSPHHRGLLLAMPPGRFVVSSIFPDLFSALSSAPGWLDLFSGSRGFAKALAAAAPCWILCLDISHSEDEDLLRPDLQDTLENLIEAGVFSGVSAGPVCSSFSTAITPPWRSREFPQGVPSLRQDQRDKVLAGNRMLEFILRVVLAAARSKTIFWIENPQGSWFWRQPAWDKVSAEVKWEDFLCDFCYFGSRWRKSTRFRTNGQLGGARLRCPGGHVHQVLRGRDRATGVSWTKLAEPYPRKLALLLGNASAQDAGWLGDFRPLDLARCARCTGQRIGEAQNPGPRRTQRRRAGLQLREVATVTKATAELRSGIWSSFRSWLDREAGADLWPTLEQQPELFVEVLLSYGQFLFETGRSLQEFRQLLAHSQQVQPKTRGCLKPAWVLLTKWERLEPTVHRTPMPEPIVWAMISLAVTWGWNSWACATLVCFLGCCRIGEILGASRAELLTPADLLQRDLRYYVIFREPKTRGRGARVQHVAIDLEPVHAAFIDRTWGPLKRSEPLFPGSPGVFRRRWDKLLSVLEVPPVFKLTPGCLRGGGAVAAYRKKRPVADIQWTIRLQNQTTLAYYLQEVSAESVLPKLSVQARRNVQTASALLPYLLRHSPAH